VHKRLTVNGILKDCVKKKGLITDGSWPITVGWTEIATH
jgi:hypothetical protein